MKSEVPDTSYFFEWHDEIVVVVDAVLTDMFSEMMNEQSDEKLTDFFIYLFQSNAEVLRKFASGLGKIPFVSYIYKNDILPFRKCGMHQIDLST